MKDSLGTVLGGGLKTTSLGCLLMFDKLFNRKNKIEEKCAPIITQTLFEVLSHEVCYNLKSIGSVIRNLWCFSVLRVSCGDYVLVVKFTLMK